MTPATVLMVSMVGRNGTKNTTAGVAKPQTEAVSQGDTAETDTTKTTEAKDTSEPLKVDLGLVSLDPPYFVRVYGQFMDKAKRNGQGVSFVDGNLDAAAQLNGIQDMANNDVDVMVVSAWFIDAMKDIFAQYKEKEIPILVIGNAQNPDAINDLIVYACNTEHYGAGFLGETWASGYFSDLGRTEPDIVIMSGSTEQMKQRGQGLMNGLTKDGAKVEVRDEYDVFTREDVMASAEDALTVYSNLDLIYGISAQGSLGAYDATVGANRTEVYVVGYDGEDEELESIDRKLNHITAIIQGPAGEVSITVEYILKYLDGEKFNRMVPILTGIYCAKGQLTSRQVLGN